MRMDALLSAQLMGTAAAHLKRGATAVVTLKVGLHRVLDTIDRCLDVLAAKGITMPDKPTWPQVADIATKIGSSADGVSTCQPNGYSSSSAAEW